MSVSIQIKGINEVREIINKQNKKALSGMKSGIAKATLHILNEVKYSIAGQRGESRSVDTGRFLNTIQAGQIDSNTSKVSSDLPYAKILEFGGVNRQPRRHFGNTAKREKQRVKELINQDVNP